MTGIGNAAAGLLSGTTNLSVDGGDILYIPDTGNDLIREIDSSGTISNISPFFATPQTLAVDAFGIIYSLNVTGSTYYFSTIYPYGFHYAFDTTYALGSTCTVSSPCSLATVGMGTPASLSIDPYNNLFFAEETEGAAEMPVGSVSATLNLWYLTDTYDYADGKRSLAVDGNNNIYTFYNYSTTACYIVSETVYGAESATPSAVRAVGGANCGFSGDGGPARSAEIGNGVGQITFDVAGNLYFTDQTNQRVRRVDYSTGQINTIAGNGTAGYTGDGGSGLSAEINTPTGLAVDSQGQVYMVSSATSGQVVRKLGTQGILTFGTQQLATPSLTKVLTVSNTGNSEMVLNNYAITGASAADFSIDATSTSCSLVAGAILATGASCKIGVIFKPAASTARSATLVFNNNTATNSNTVLLTGTGVATAITFSPASLAFGSETVGATTASQTVTMTNSASTAVTITSIVLNGTNPTSYQFLNTCGSSLAAGASCTIHGHFSPTKTGSLPATITVTDSAGNSPQTISLTGTGTAAPSKKSSAVSVKSSANPATTCKAVSFTATVTAKSGSKPTGEVQFLDAGKLLGTAIIKSGEAKFSMVPSEAETLKLTANYAGDTLHDLAVSKVMKLKVNAASKSSKSCAAK